MPSNLYDNVTGKGFRETFYGPIVYILRTCDEEQSILIVEKGLKHKIITYNQDSMVGIKLESIVRLYM